MGRVAEAQYFRNMTESEKKERDVLAVVVPCYNEEAVLHETTRRLTELLDRLAQQGAVS